MAAKIAGALFLLWLIICLLPTIGQRYKTTHLHSVFVDEHTALMTYVEKLAGQSEDRTSTRCYPEDQGYFRTSAYCDELAVYTYNATANTKTIDALKQAARTLDQQLKKQGWTIDRPQDPYKTLEQGADYAYTKQFAPYVGVQIPYHKNIGSISCNLRITFGGSRSGSDVPGVSVDDFRCSQRITYIAPRLHKEHHTII